jgi:adenosine kinase
MGSKQIVICGSIAIDRIMNFTGRYRDLIKPDKLHVLSVSPLLDKLENSPGGVGANIAHNLAILGEAPILIGSVGPDAKSYIDYLSGRGIDTSHIHISTLPTASFNVITDSENNQVGGFYQGAMSDSDSLTFEHWKDKNVVAMVSAHNPKAMNRQVAECQQYNLPLIYDPGQQVSDPETDLNAGLNAATVLFVNDYEMGLLCENTGLSQEAIKSKVEIVVTTLGKDGSVIEGAAVDAPIHIAIASPAQVTDPTGAGDAYRAGFLYGYLRQWGLIDCGRLGSVVASFIVEQHGTQQDYSLQAVKKRYRQTFNTEVTL